jgi:hypothetical protein
MIWSQPLSLTQQALTKIPTSLTYAPCINRWSSAVMPKEMYALIDAMPFHFKVAPKTDVPDFPPVFEADCTKPKPYTCKQTISISRKFNCNKNYYKMWINIYCAMCNTLDTHIVNAIKTAPLSNCPALDGTVIYH